jgi:hypothetical protein
MTPNVNIQPFPAPQPALAGRSAGQPFWRTNLPLTVTALAAVALLAATVVGVIVDPRVITGAPAWVKPMKFANSTVVYCGTLAWLLGFVQGHRRLVGLVGYATSLSLVVELVIIVGQVLRGSTSHFNISTPLDAALWSAMAGFISLVWVMNLIVAVLLIRQRLPDAAFAWSLRLGVLLSAVGMVVAFLMTGHPTPAQAAAMAAGQAPTHFGAHSVGVEDGGPGLPFLGWSTTGGDLRVAHFVGLHGLQVLPLLGLLLGRLGWLNSRQRLGLVWTAGLGYLGLILLLTWQALRGQPLIAPDALTLAALGALGAGVGGASAVIMRRSGIQD